MARLHELPEKYGTIENMFVYPMYGHAYTRGASSLTATISHPGCTGTTAAVHG